MRVVIDCPAFREQLSRAHALAQTGWDEAADYALNWTLSHKRYRSLGIGRASERDDRRAPEIPVKLTGTEYIIDGGTVPTM